MDKTITLIQKAEKYAEEHCYTEPKKAFLAGYSEGYGDARQIECIPSDEMLTKIVHYLDKGYFLSQSMSINDYLKYIKEHLYNN